MKKLLIVGVFLLFSVGSYIFIAELSTEIPEIDLDGNFDRVLDEVDSYGGAMIVTYDTETGEILNKRAAHKQTEAGVLSVSEDEYKQSGSSLPKDSVIAKDTLTPIQAIEYGGGN